MNLICYHGSPGLPEEFKELGHHLKDSFKVLAPFRRGYSHSNESFHIEHGIRVGYSWGSVDCISDSLKNPTQGIILISPYLFQKKQPSLIQKAALSAPGLGNWILRKSGHRIIDQFLKKSCDPTPVPEAYRKISNQLMEPQILKTAALEKTVSKNQIIHFLQLVKKNKIPLALIYGDQDKTSLPSEQIDPIKKILSPTFEERVQDGGHALPWTHPHALAKAIMKFKEILK